MFGDTLSRSSDQTQSAKIAGKAFSTQSSASTSSIHGDLASLSQELAAFKRHGNPPFVDIQSFAERIWRANLSYEIALAKLEREKMMLTKQIDTIWGSFDTLIRPLWRVDDAIVPVYDALADLRIHLEDLYQQKLDVIASSSATREQVEMIEEEVVEVQKKLHLLEEMHSREGKFVGEGWRVGDHVPSGQAIVANLLAKNYRLVRMINETEPLVDKSLLPIQLRLDNILRTLRAFRTALFAKLPVEPLELTALQTQVDSIANLQKDGKFVDENDSVPQGQATLQEMLEDAYDLIHVCLVQLETEEAEITTALAELTERVREVLSGLYVVGPDEQQQPRDLLNTPTALHTLSETLSEGYAYIKDSASAAGTAATGSLASLVRSGFNAIGKLLGNEAMDPTLQPVLMRLLNLKHALMKLRSERDKAAMERIRSGNVGSEMDSGKRDSYEIRTHLVLLEEMDMDRDEMGRFVNADGGAPEQGQTRLKNLLEECFVVAYELV